MNYEQIVWRTIVVVLLAPLPIGLWAFGWWAAEWWSAAAEGKVPAMQITPASVRLSDGMLRLGGGSFRMGGGPNSTQDRLPAHVVRLDPFWIDQTTVTNAQFARFVAAADYVTTAQQSGASLVFDTNRGKWRELAGANWRQPAGPRSSLIALDDFPVVHVSWRDAAAYAEWAGKRLVTEAEYEYAARGGLLDGEHAWGERTPTAAEPLANYWQGRFPTKDLGLDGFRSLAPVAQYPAGRFGLYDMAGNVWCWCGDWYDAEAYVASRVENPQGPSTGDERVLRGGSWLSTAGDRDELEVAARGHAPPEHTAGNIGFRCARSAGNAATAGRKGQHKAATAGRGNQGELR